MNRKWDRELMTVLNFLDCLSGCTFACAVDKGPGDFLVSVICKGMEFRGRKRVVLRTDSEAISALTTAVCPARAEETILENSPKYSSPRGCESLGGRTDQDDKSTTGAGAKDRDQHHGSCRSTDRSTRFLVAESIKLVGSSAYSATEGWPYGGEVVELGEQVYWKVPGLTQKKVEEGWRRGTWLGNAERLDENMADGDGVHMERSIQRRPGQHRWSSQKVKELVGSPRERTPKKTKMMEPRFPRRYITWALLQKHGPHPGMQVVSRLAWRTL